jgi:hypothetical protein
MTKYRFRKLYIVLTKDGLEVTRTPYINSAKAICRQWEKKGYTFKETKERLGLIEPK